MLAFTTWYLAASNAGLWIGQPASTDSACILQSVIEPVGDFHNSTRISGDGGSESTYHQGVHLSTILGAPGKPRNNNFYDETKAPEGSAPIRRTHELMSLVGNIWSGPCATKGDLFRQDPTATGNWVYSHSVGCPYNIECSLSNFAKDYRGLNHLSPPAKSGTAPMLDLGFVNNASEGGSKAGKGDYRLTAGSPALSRVLRVPLKWDLAGQPRNLAGSAAGAYEEVAKP